LSNSTDTTLITLRKSWQESVWLFEQLGFASNGDAIVLTQDAVLALQSPITLASFLAKCKAGNISVFALNEDCQLRGIENQHKPVKLIEYDGYLELVTQHSKQLSW
jgi:sulfur relay protein TusB/DsrH